MPRLIRPILLAVLVLGLAPLAAPAREMRFPAKGYPAFIFDLPEDWSAKPEDAGTLVLTSANRSVKLVLFVGESSDPLEKVASAALASAGAVPPQASQGMEISGYKGRLYYSTMRTAKRIRQDLELAIVQLDRTHIAMMTLILPSNLTPLDESTARSVQTGLRLRGNH